MCEPQSSRKGGVAIRVAVLGAPDVGKTSFISCLLDLPLPPGRLTPDLTSSFHTSYLACMCRPDSRGQVQRVQMTILEQPGVDTHTDIHVVIAVYDVGRYQSYIAVGRELRYIRQVSRSLLLLFLVANKTDIFPPEVKHEEGWRLCLELGIHAYNFVETSCLQDAEWIRAVFFSQLRRKAYLHHCQQLGYKTGEAFVQIEELPIPDCCSGAVLCEKSCLTCPVCCVL